jgi:hypothetical protein
MTTDFRKISVRIDSLLLQTHIGYCLNKNFRMQIGGAKIIIRPAEMVIAVIAQLV